MNSERARKLDDIDCFYNDYEQSSFTCRYWDAYKSKKRHISFITIEAVNGLGPQATRKIPRAV
jgi:hypothetical protein